MFNNGCCIALPKESPLCTDCHVLLGDLGMEQESFEAALHDYNSALGLLRDADQVTLRQRELQNYS